MIRPPPLASTRQGVCPFSNHSSRAGIEPRGLCGDWTTEALQYPGHHVETHAVAEPAPGDREISPCPTRACGKIG